MENASKALIIAGAILLAILIVGIGMAVYNGTTGTTSEAIRQMNTQEIEMFNNQFNQYAGSAVVGSNVKALLQKVSSNNSSFESTDARRVIVFLNNNSAGGVANATEVTDFSTSMSSIISAAQYTVVTRDPVTDAAGTGNSNKDSLISTIVITRN